MIRGSFVAVSLVIASVGTQVASADRIDWEMVVGPGAATPAGFGDANNTFAVSAVVSGQFVYLGTFNEVTGAEVWRTTDGTSWTQVNSNGFGHPENQGVYSMTTFLGYVFAATWGGFTVGPPTRVWRSPDGTTWTQANIDGFGDTDTAEPHSMAVHNGFLHVGVSNFPDGAEVWESVNGFNFSQANVDGFGDGDNQQVFALESFEGSLYAGTENVVDGAQMRRTDGGGLSWAQVNSDGFGDSDNTAIWSTAVLDDTLFAGTWNGSTGAEVWRSANGTTWTQANADGFGESANWAAASMAVVGGALYVGTYNTGGAEVWATGDGASWSQVNSDGFGSSSNFQVRVLVEHNGALYAGVSNGSGLRVYRARIAVFADGFESGGTSRWSSVVP